MALNFLQQTYIQIPDKIKKIHHCRSTMGEWVHQSMGNMSLEEALGVFERMQALPQMDTKEIQATYEKEAGNLWFKRGDYDKSIARYTEGMSLDPNNAMLPANRAMALLKKRRYAEAEADCTLALSIDSTYVKAYQRRASARTGQGKYDLAIGDYEQILKLEPSNKAAQNEKRKLVEKLKSVHKEVKSLKKQKDVEDKDGANISSEARGPTGDEDRRGTVCANPGCSTPRPELRLHRCSRCLQASFCSQSCLVQHWPVHSRACREHRPVNSLSEVD